MDKHLYLKVTTSCEGVFTHYESERFVSKYMRLYVHFEVSSLSAGVIALCAVERLSPECVSMCVLDKLARLFVIWIIREYVDGNAIWCVLKFLTLAQE